MAVVVSDATPLNYLVLIEAVEILPRLYGRVLIPPALPPDPALSQLDAGESQAMALALTGC